MRSARIPKIGAASMYETRNAVASAPVLAMDAISCSRAGPPVAIAAGKNAWRMSGSTAAST